MKKSIWIKWDKETMKNNQNTKPLLKSEFIKKSSKKLSNHVQSKNTKNYSSIFSKKDNQYAKPTKYIPLDFETKFEIIRTAPKMKGNASPVKLANQARPDQVKSEYIQSLGEMQILAFTRFEDFDFKYELNADGKTLMDWRLFLGERINQIGFHHLFKVYRKIGKGNFASVYLAERVEDGQQMAIKAFSKTVAYAEENGREGLINEINIMRRLSHPNIIKLYEVHETQNSLYMGLELLEGGQLFEYLKKKVIFQNKEIQVIIKGLLEGLKHIHDRDIMHRDIKLENILFKKQNSIDSVVLADFGLATNVNEDVYLYCRCGTPGFVAPEVINIKDLKTKYDKVCDIYSLGLVFHLLITGKPAFPGRSYTTIVNQNKEAKITWRSSIFEIIPQKALDLMKRMLEVDPKKRITADQALNHDYFHPTKAFQDFDDEIINDDPSLLKEKLDRINEMNNRFDMLRINQLTNSPIKSPNIKATQTSEMKASEILENKNDQIIMHTPVITGRTDSINDSPVNIQQIQQNHHQRQKSLSYLQKYSDHLQLEKIQLGDTEEKDQQIQQVKQTLNKNL